MLKKTTILTLLAVLLLGISGYGQPLRVACAANAQYAVKEIARVFQDKTGIRAEIVAGSSGKLAAQVIHGAPFSIYLAANMEYAQKIRKKGLAAAPPKVYARGELVLWTVREDFLQDEGFGFLKNTKVEKIAVANPSLAPYGIAAMQVMNAEGLLPEVKSKLVYGESVSQASQYIYTGAVDAGFTAKAIVMAPGMKGKGEWMEIPANAYAPIQQGAVLLKNKGEQQEKAQKLYAFLFSEEAQSIFKKYGYLVTE